MGLVWVLGAREPAPLIQQAPASTIVTPPLLSQSHPPQAHVQEHTPTAPPAADEPAAKVEPAEASPDRVPQATPELEVEEPSPAPIDAAIDQSELPQPGSGEEAVPDEPRDDKEPEPEPPLTIRIRINSAPPSELELLPGVGPVIAKRIADDRAANGPFKDLRALQRVKGIGPKTAEKLAPHVRFD